MNSGTGFDFSAGTSGNVTYGDFYYGFYNNASKFWANNVGMQGLVDVGVVTGSLQSVVVPATGYSTQGVLAVVNHVYVSKAATSEPNWYIIFRVTSVSSNDVTLSWVYVNRS
jgi:hypothetical protein